MDMKANHDQFQSLVKATLTELYRYAYWLCNDKTIAEDLVQETYARAWRAFDSLREASSAKAWLITILRRENARRFEKSQPVYNDELTVNQEADKDYDTSTEAHVLRVHLKKLPEKYREPLVLQVVGGYSCEEIANQLGIEKNAVMTRLFRARNMLKKKLGHETSKERAELCQ